jgi:hypothetical protein
LTHGLLRVLLQALGPNPHTIFAPKICFNLLDVLTARSAGLARVLVLLRRESLRISVLHKFVCRFEISFKMKFAVFASLLASAAAFAPAQQSARTSVATNMAFENEIGAQQPLGYWDPLGLVADGDQEKFDRLRYVEIKHGRICMLAVAGYLTQEAGIRLPGDIDYSGTSFESIPNGFAALSAVPGAGIAQIIAFIGFLEIAVMKDITGGEFVGDFRNNYLDFGWDTFSEDKKLQKRAIELNQGRAAQMGILALMVHEQLGVSILP